mmetsp:Transcript_34439/g.75375  ORF Transcript_34439/g.75375 Transcript_34439/m.75375 type:complete len:308 (+) Transcript_34439:1-924(+)
MTSLLSLNNLIQASSGALGSVVSITVLYPLETARTRLQVDPKLKPRSSIPLIISLARREGIGALYRGWASLVVALGVTNFTYFYTFHALRTVWMMERDSAKAATDMVFSTIAGLVTVLVTNPLWVANTILKLQDVPKDNEDRSEQKEWRYKSLWGCLTGIIRHEGPGALWAGTASSLLLISNPTIQFVVYEYLKRTPLVKVGGQEMNAHLRHLVNGALSKLCATVATYPLQVIQTQRRAGRLSTNQLKRRSSFLSVFDHATIIIKREGVGGFYRGLEAKLLQTICNAGLMFLVYEELLSAVKSVFDR